MTQLVGFILTRSANNYTLLFTMTPATYLFALARICLASPCRH
jgi:ACS family hexuronate transporter-like MFS transporter